MSSVAATSQFFDHESQQVQTAIDKVKKNEALTHPKLLGKKEEEAKISVVKSHHGRHSSNNVVRETSPKLTRKKSGKQLKRLYRAVVAENIRVSINH